LVYESDADDDVPVSTHPHRTALLQTHAWPFSIPTQPIQYENPQTGERRKRRAATASTLNGEKKFRAPGGRPAMNKRVTADYDSDDALIVTLKQQGYSDKAVAERLAKDGRTAYQAKSVGSRWLRLRQVVREEEEKRLDDELSDWHIGEVSCVTSTTSLRNAS
jgi:hypothetical protein